MKITATALALILATSAANAISVDLGTRSGYTPYDRFMKPVKTVLHRADGDIDDMNRVRQLLRVGRSFRYSFTEPYLAAMPEVTGAVRAGDCKAKSLWLIDQMNDDDVRYVIGKARSNSRLSHAWVLWKHDGRWWILDPTNRREPIAADRVRRNEYIPQYSYDRAGSYRHASTSMMVADSAVAGKRDRRVAVASKASSK